MAPSICSIFFNVCRSQNSGVKSLQYSQVGLNPTVQCGRTNTLTRLQDSGQASGMRKGIILSRRHANFPRKISKENVKNNRCLAKYAKKLKRLQKSVKGNESRVKKSLDFSYTKLITITNFLTNCLQFTSYRQNKSLKTINCNKTDMGIHFSNTCPQRTLLLDLQDLSSLFFLFRGEHGSLSTVFLILGDPVSL